MLYEPSHLRAMQINVRLAVDFNQNPCNSEQIEWMYDGIEKYEIEKSESEEAIWGGHSLDIHQMNANANVNRI